MTQAQSQSQSQSTQTDIATDCCVVGGGPAGMMLGYLLARAGIRTTVLEKHADFLRDFRGDTVHPSTLQIMDELGLLDDFLKRPHQRIAVLNGEFSGQGFRVADLTRLPVRCPFIAFMPQWEFLNFLAEKGAALPNLTILRSTEAIDLIQEQGRVVGAVARTASGTLRITADLTVGCDGRHSTIRTRAGLPVEDIGAPIDVLWFRVGKGTDTVEPAFLRAGQGQFVVTIDRGDYWQCAYVIAKGGIDRIRAAGLDAFHDAVVSVAPGLRSTIRDVKSWDDVKLLSVAIDRLRHWSRPGLLCIGDAAHAMSPVGGVGINLAIQDAVAAANILAGPLRRGCPDEAALDAVRRRRLFPVRVIQGIQVMVQKRVIGSALRGEGKPPLAVRLIDKSRWLQGLTARLLALGVRPEHVRA